MSYTGRFFYVLIKRHVVLCLKKQQIKGYFMKRSKIALALIVAVSMLSLTACNDDDDSPASNQKTDLCF